MNVRWTSWLAAWTVVLLGGTLLATAAAPNTGENQSAMQGSAGIIQTSKLMGTTVLNSQGKEKVGQIKDVLLDPQSGRATFVILDVEIPGSGHAMLVVPYQSLRVSSRPSDNHQSVMLDVRPENLHAAPQIQNNQWQVLQNPQFLEQARNFYQSGTYTAARPIEVPPSLPSPSVEPAMPPPCVNPVDAGSGLPQDLIDFYGE